MIHGYARVPALVGPASELSRDRQEMLQMERISLSLDDVRAIKKYATRDAPYFDRVSVGFAVALAHLRETLGEDHHVLHEIDVLEGLAANSSTKESEQFRRPPLHPFWHKHFSTARHLKRNMGVRWGLEKSGNRDLSAMIEGVAVGCGDQPDLWPKRLVHQLVLGGLDDRAAARRMTGDWIIFAKHGGRNVSLLLCFVLIRSESGSSGDPGSRIAISGHGFEDSAPTQVRGKVFGGDAVEASHPLFEASVVRVDVVYMELQFFGLGVAGRG